MAFDNRDYYREEQRRYGGGGGFRGPGGISANIPGAVLWLIVINVVVFVVDVVLRGSSRGDAIAPLNWGAFSVEQGILGFQIWRPLTYQFIHADFFHLLFNMIGLWVFGQFIERYLGSKRLVAYYLLCGLGGAVLFGLVSLIPAIAGTDTGTPVVGASGCVLGLVAGCLVKFPREQLMFFFIPVAMTMKVIGIFYIGIDLLQVLAGGRGAGGATAHLGGALMGFLLITRVGWLNWADRVNPQAVQDGINRGRHERKVKAEANREQQIDAILAKVSEHGLQSLTKREKKLLQDDTARKNTG